MRNANKRKLKDLARGTFFRNESEKCTTHEFSLYKYNYELFFSSKLFNLVHWRNDSKLRVNSSSPWQAKSVSMNDWIEKWKVTCRRFLCISSFFASQFPGNLDWNVGQLSAWHYIVLHCGSRYDVRCALQHPVFFYISQQTRIYETLYSKLAESNFSRLSTVLTMELVLLRKLGQ